MCLCPGQQLKELVEKSENSAIKNRMMVYFMFAISPIMIYCTVIIHRNT